MPQPIFSSTPRTRRHRPQPQESPQAESAPFFQPKLTINQPGDAHEREADAVADRVVSEQNAAVGPSGGQAVQRLATPDEEKMPGTNDARMKEDKQIQEKPDIQRADAPKEEEKPVQKMEAPKEEEQPVQKADAPKEEEKPVQKMEAPKEEEPVQKMEAPKEEEPVQKMDAPKEEEPVQKKGAEAATRPASPQFGSRLAARKGRGEPLQPAVRSKMEQGIGADFSRVRIHTDSEAVEMSRDIQAQAFTQGRDIYFGNGKFSPQTTDGQRLLAHELTHVVQQNGGSRPQNLQKKDVPGTSTPVPKKFNVEKDDDGNVTQSTGTAAGVAVIILPDRFGETAHGTDGATALTVGWETPGFEANADGILTKVTDIAKITLTIQTTYLPGTDPKGESDYGRGTTAKDQKAGKKSLRFHEGSHGTEAIAYLKKHAPPKFTGKKGMTIDEFHAAVAAFDQKMTDYQAALQSSNIAGVDCVGTPGSMCKP